MRLFGFSVAVLLVVGGLVCGGQDRPTAEARPKGGIMVWDTTRPASEAIAPAAFSGKKDWNAIPAGKTADSFAGDAVIGNGRIVAVLRKQDSAVEVHAIKPDGAISRFRLRLLSSKAEPAVQLEQMALVENSRSRLASKPPF